MTIMKMKRVVVTAIALGVVVLLVSGCHGSQNMVYNSLSQTEVVLSQNNFRVVGSAEGVYKGQYVFGLGGSSKSLMQENAVQQMYKNAKLRGSQTIINVCYSISTRTIFLFYKERVVTAYGTIIEFK